MRRKSRKLNNANIETAAYVGAGFLASTFVANQATRIVKQLNSPLAQSGVKLVAGIATSTLGKGKTAKSIAVGMMASGVVSAAMYLLPDSAKSSLTAGDTAGRIAALPASEYRARAIASGVMRNQTAQQIRTA